jgi:nitronate monooxygenase
VTFVDSLRHPIVLAPLAGGPQTPELAAAVNEAGGFGFLAAGYLSIDDLGQRIARLRTLSDRPFGVNLFVPSPPTDPSVFAAYAETIRAEAASAGLPVGEAAYTDDGWEAKLDLLTTDPPAIVSFTFGCPSPEVIARVKAAGSEAWVTVTSSDEAVIARAAGADGVALQGGEAGGHRGTFVNTADMPTFGIRALLELTADLGLPRMAAGGIMTGSAVADMLRAGACAAVLGTAFLNCPEAGTPQPHRDALGSGRPTRLTQSFSGRMARGIVNAFMDRHDAAAVAAYPEINSLTSPLRAAARERGDADWINLWAGQAYPLARAEPAGDVVRRIATELAS